MRKMKVALFAENLIRDFDGATRTMFQFIDKAHEFNTEFHFFCGSDTEDFLEKELTILPSIRVPTNNSYRFVNIWQSRSQIVNKLKALRPDLIHIASPSPMGAFAARYGKRNGIPVVSIYHTHFISYVRYYSLHIPIVTQLAERAVKRRLKKFYNNCDKVLVPTKVIKKELKALGVKNSKISMWERGVNRRVFSPSRRQEDYFSKITKNQNKNILFVSRLVWEKNLKLLTDIYTLLQQSRLTYNLIIVGEGVAGEKLRQLMPKAFFLGQKTHIELSTIYASADIFLFPSISETYGNVIIEAMASGLPCLVANAGGSASHILHGENGFLCSPKDPMDFIRHIKILTRQPDTYRSITKSGLNYVETFSWDRLIRRFYNIYTSLVSIENEVIMKTEPIQEFEFSVKPQFS